MNESTETIVPATPPPKLCEIASVLGRTVHELLVAAPTNPIVRAHCLARLGREIPPELTEYPAIKDWVEHNITPPKAQSQPRTDRDITINVTRTCEVRGTCSYSDTESGTDDVTLTGDRLRELAEDAHNMNELVAAVYAALDEPANEIPTETSGGEVIYSDYEPRLRDKEDIRCDRRLVREEVLEWLRDAMPELLEEWEGE
jgi:hypothetical protein